MSKRFGVLLAVTLLAFLLAQVTGCAPASTPSVEAEATPRPTSEAPPTPMPEPTVPQVVEFVGLVRSPPGTLDPAVGSDLISYYYLIATYEPLIRLEPGTMDLEPCLAESWEISEDGAIFTFELREGVSFHDGTALDAEDVKLSIERIKEIGLGFAWILDTLKEVNVVDAMTVEIVLDEPSAIFLEAVPLLLMVSSEAVEAHEKQGDLAQDWLAENEAGTGPYMLESLTLGQELVLSKFDDYWRGWEGEHVDRIIQRVVAEPATQAMTIEAGEAHWADSITIEDAEMFNEDPRLNVVWCPTYIMWLALDTNTPPLDDARVRRALRYAFPYETMVEDIMRGHATIPRGYLVTNSPALDPTIPEEHQDLGAARELLADAGYAGGGFTLELVYYAPLDWERKTAEVYQSVLAELGIQLELSGDPWPAVLEKATTPELRTAMSMIAAGPRTSSPDSTLYQTFHSKSGHWSNYGYSNPQVDALLDAARVEFDEVERTELYREVQQILQEDSPAINTTTMSLVAVFSADAKGFVILPMWPSVVDPYLISIE